MRTGPGLRSAFGRADAFQGCEQSHGPPTSLGCDIWVQGLCGDGGDCTTNRRPVLVDQVEQTPSALLCACEISQHLASLGSRTPPQASG